MKITREICEAAIQDLIKQYMIKQLSMGKLGVIVKSNINKKKDKFISDDTVKAYLKHAGMEDEDISPDHINSVRNTLKDQALATAANAVQQYKNKR
jgi:hypothetical protein